MDTKTKQSGFTLVELAIVLVIIGLLVGGVLVGQDLIKAATLQKGIRQLSDTEAAATTFRTKYNALPGDLKGETAVNTFTVANGFPVAIVGASSTITGNGDNDDQIEATTTAGGSTIAATLGASGETAIFYPELYDAGYIKDQMSYGTVTTAPTTAVGTFLPFTVAGTNKPYVVPQSMAGKNYLTIVGAPTAMLAVPTTWTPGLTPGDASSIDGKLDDGIPTTGGVISIGDLTGSGSPVPGKLGTVGTATTGCYNGTAGAAVYNTALTTQNCSISYRASF
jgi:prepilin-type N-terminal cleavage/methylation domain-containing protein